MNVYVESGFVLTLALRQDDYQAAEKILQFAQQRRITLKLPAFSLSEPFATLQYRANSRNRLIDELRKEMRELGRTQPYEHMARELRQYTMQMAQIRQTQLDAMEAAVMELSRHCELLQLDSSVLMWAFSYRTTYALQPQDAIILASIIVDLENSHASGDSLFISQNVKDFVNPLVQDALQRVHCKYLADFTNAVRFIERPAGQAEAT